MRTLSEYIKEAMGDAKRTPLDEKEVETLKSWFDEHVKVFEPIEKNGTLSIYFPDRATLKAVKDRVGLSNIPHMTFSKPKRLKGGFGLTIYKKDNWAGSEFPSPTRAFDENGKPKYATVEDVIALLDKNFAKRWANRLDADMK